MKTYVVHTEETVHGVYHVEATSPQDARKKFENDPHKIGEQKLYEAIYAEVERVEKTPLEDQ